MPTGLAWLDHFVVAIDDLEKGIASFEEATSVRPAFGGEHPALGTHNALVSLGTDRYFEILAPRPGATLSPLFGDAGDHDTLTPIKWAVATADIDAAHRAVTEAGFPAPEPLSGSRATPTGDTVRWSMFMFEAGAPAGAPFVLQWDDRTPHPATKTPRGCTLADYEVRSHDADRLVRLLTALGVDAPVRAGPDGISVTLNTPAGPVRYGA